MASGRNRILGIAGAAGANALILAALLTLHGSRPVPGADDPGLVAIVTPSRRPPPPEPDAAPQGAAAEPSGGASAEPSPAEPERPLASPVPAAPSVDAGAGVASGAGAVPGAGEGAGGEGAGSGAGSGGSGSGAGTVTPPVRIAGSLGDGDYRRAAPPKGARGTVAIAFQVSAAGRVERCAVERSSGYVALDQATCRLVVERYRFRPARNAAGEPIAWTLRTDFTWVPR